jgi:phosphate uptake regulator
MVLSFFRSGGDGLESVERTIQQMLADDRHSFDAAVSALLGGADPDLVGPDLRATDRRVNAGERTIRQELVVHTSVQGGSVDVPSVLVYMSIVKDIERIGDYAKNIYDLAAEGVDLSGDDDRDQLIAYRDRISSMISEVAQVFADRDVDGARELIAEGDGMLDTFDDLVDQLVRSPEPGYHSVPRALFYRHVKRIVAHLMNVLSAVVMPVHQIDYFDEDRSTRG